MVAERIGSDLDNSYGMTRCVADSDILTKPIDTSSRITTAIRVILNRFPDTTPMLVSTIRFVAMKFTFNFVLKMG